MREWSRQLLVGFSYQHTESMLINCGRKQPLLLCLLWNVLYSIYGWVDKAGSGGNVKCGYGGNAIILCHKHWILGTKFVPLILLCVYLSSFALSALSKGRLTWLSRGAKHHLPDIPAATIYFPKFAHLAIAI